MSSREAIAFAIELVIAVAIEMVIVFCASNFRPAQHHDMIHFRNSSTYSVHVYAQDNTTGWCVGLLGVMY